MTATASFTTPVGRIVGGSLFIARDKNFDGRPLLDRDNNPRSEYVLLVAFEKNKPATEAMVQEIVRVARESFPTLFAHGHQPHGFSYKITDGDQTTPNQKGNVPARKEGYPGHWVLTFKSSFAPSVCGRSHEPIVDTKAVKTGDYVRLSASCRGNGQPNKPGVYLNLSLVQLVGYGPEIRTGISAEEAFASAPELPQGASVTPIAPSSPLPGVPGTPSGPAPAPAAASAFSPAPAAASAFSPAPVPAPLPYSAVPLQAVPPPTPLPLPPPPLPPPPSPVMTPSAPGSYADMRALGWTDDLLRQHGYMV